MLYFLREPGQIQTVPSCFKKMTGRELAPRPHRGRDHPPYSQALRERATIPEIIATIHGEGYRFCGRAGAGVILPTPELKRRPVAPFPCLRLSSARPGTLAGPQKQHQTSPPCRSGLLCEDWSAGKGNRTRIISWKAEVIHYTMPARHQNLLGVMGNPPTAIWLIWTTARAAIWKMGVMESNHVCSFLGLPFYH